MRSSTMLPNNKDAGNAGNYLPNNKDARDAGNYSYS